MAGELQVSYQPGKVVYFLVRNAIGQIWNTGTVAFEAYLTANYANYKIAGTEQGAASAFYAGNMPSAITAGIYSVVAKNQPGGSPAESDTTIADGDLNWNGTVTMPLSDTATSGQVGTYLPLRLFRGQMFQNYGVYFKSSTDHVTAFTSGVISGQIVRDGGTSWGALQSGAFTEQGNGFYNLQALTSGDLLANSVRMLFTAVGISGGSADPVPQFIILQRSSGQAG